MVEKKIKEKRNLKEKLPITKRPELKKILPNHTKNIESACAIKKTVKMRPMRKENISESNDYSKQDFQETIKSSQKKKIL